MHLLLYCGRTATHLEQVVLLDIHWVGLRACKIPLLQAKWPCCCCLVRLGGVRGEGIILPLLVLLHQYQLLLLQHRWAQHVLRCQHWRVQQ